LKQGKTHSLLSCSGGSCRGVPEGKESEFADPGIGPPIDEDDKGERDSDFTGLSWDWISCCNVRGDNRTKVFTSKSVAGLSERGSVINLFNLVKFCFENILTSPFIVWIVLVKLE
jgi:hypothetical protein